MFNSLLTRIIGSRNDRLLRQLDRIVAKTNALEAQMQALSDADLQAKTAEFKRRHAEGESLDKLLPEAFAVCREASVRVLGMRHYDVQLVGGMVLSLMTLPTIIISTRAALKAVPPSIRDAALGVGASRMQSVFHHVLPLAMPGVLAVAVFVIVFSWNEFLFALTFVLDNNERTVPVSISLISGASAFEIPWGKIMAASVIVTLPLIALVLVFQRKIVSGLTAGGVKG